MNLEKCSFYFLRVVITALVLRDVMMDSVRCEDIQGCSLLPESLIETSKHACSIGRQCSSPQIETWNVTTSFLLANIVAHLQWKHVVIIFDHEMESEVMEVTRHLSSRHMYHTLYQLEPLTSHRGLDTLLQTGSDYWLQQLRFLILCNANNTSLLLQRVNQFQARQKARSALPLTSQWLLLQDPDGPDSLELCHMTMINMATVYCRSQNTCCEFPPSSTGLCGQVTTILTTGDVRSLACLGTVDDVIAGHADIFPGRQWGFNRRLLSVSTLPWEGFVETRDYNGTLAYSGLCIDLLNVLAAQLNFTYTLSQPSDGIWGIRYDNGTWAGLVGQVANWEVDLVIAPLTVTQQREEVVDFTYPFFNDVDTVIYRKADPKKDKWRTYLQPLKWQVLACIGISLLFASFFLGFIESWTPFYPGNRLASCRGRHVSYFRSFRLMYGALLAQADEDLPRSYSGRVLVSFWWLFSIVVAATFSGNLIAFLTVDKTSLLFVTLHDLLNQDVYKWGFLGGSAIHQTIKASNSSLYGQLWSKVERWSAIDPDYLTKDVSVHYTRLLQGEYAFISDRATFERWKANRCDLELARVTFLPTDYGIALPNNSAYVRLFSNEILKMHENGLLAKMRERWWPDDNSTCQPPTTTKSTPATLTDMQSAFYLLLVGSALGLLALLLEFLMTLSLWTRLKTCIVKQKH